MSRTIRAMPQRGNGLKWFAKTFYESKKVTGRTIWPIYRFVPLPKMYSWHSWEDRYDKIVIGLEHKTQEDHDKYLAEEHIKWCRKNGTCKRQRKNAARIAKQNFNQQTRARLKRNLRTLVEETMTDNLVDLSNGEDSISYCFGSNYPSKIFIYM